jgi:alkaline phosphatase
VPLPLRCYPTNNCSELHADYPQYIWYPEVLANVSNSAEYLARRLRAEMAASPLQGNELKKHINERFVQSGLGIQDATDGELQYIIDNPSSYFLADMISQRAQIGWSTHGHSAVDVNIYGTSGSSFLGGNHENIDIGKFMRNYLNVQVDGITEELKEWRNFRAENSVGGWTGRVPTEEDIRSVLRQHEGIYD